MPKEKGLLAEALDKIDSSFRLDTFVLTKKDQRIQEILLDALAELKAREINRKNNQKLERPIEEKDETQDLLELLTSDPEKFLEKKFRKNKVDVNGQKKS